MTGTYSMPTAYSAPPPTSSMVGLSQPFCDTTPHLELTIHTPPRTSFFGGPAISPTLASPLVSASLSISSGAPVFFDGSYYSNVQTNVLSPKSYGVDVRSDLILSELFIFIQSATFMFGQVDSPVSYD